MYSTETLTINGYRNEPVPHTFFKCATETDHLAILFPGLHYTVDMPLLYYSRHLLEAIGTDILSVEYAYGRRADFEALDFEGQQQWLLTDATAIYRVGAGQRSYRQITFIGKSIGTLNIGHLLTSEAMTAQAEAIWLTPLLLNQTLRAQLTQCWQRSLFVIGTADPYYDATYLTEIQEATGNEALLLEGAHHSLNIANNVLQSIQTLEQVMRAMEIFLTKD